jgi:mono/diheme cytochrome c family protein
MNARLLASLFAAAAAGQDKVDFATAIQPIFAEHCYQCHGPKEQEADLRLDRRASVFHDQQANWVIRPGKPE